MSSINFRLSKNKSIEFQLNLFDDLSKHSIVEFSFNWTLCQDHAGPGLQIIIYRVLYFHIMIYDHRHWSWIDNDWEDN